MNNYKEIILYNNETLNIVTNDVVTMNRYPSAILLKLTSENCSMMVSRWDDENALMSKCLPMFFCSPSYQNFLSPSSTPRHIKLERLSMPLILRMV